MEAVGKLGKRLSLLKLIFLAKRAFARSFNGVAVE